MTQAALEVYAKAFAELTPDSVGSLCGLVSEQIHFRDPFNDIHGSGALRHLLMDMFERAGRPEFRLMDVAWHDSTGTGWLRWHFNTTLPIIGVLDVEGCSRVRLDEDGLVSEHLDFWDSAPIYLQLPFIGRILRRIHRRISSQS